MKLGTQVEQMQEPRKEWQKIVDKYNKRNDEIKIHKFKQEVKNGI